MKRIAVFCDGTWNSPTLAQPTHIVKLYNAVHQQLDVQIAHYFSGVGVKRNGAGFLSNALNRIGGGAFGWGLDRNIKQAYAYVCDNYEPDDEILIFGFSRGAYTARSLAGMIRKCGILDRLTRSTLDDAYTFYKSPGPANAPDEAAIRQGRRQRSPRFATSQADKDWRGDTSAIVKISYIGIWDTVGSLGIPDVLLGPVAKLWNRKYEFHDTNLSSMVQSGRHALALDERRQFFQPADWKNLDEHAGGPGLNKGRTGPDRPFQQQWFIGDHGIVGGTGASRGLSAITLSWIAEGAQRAGLTLRDDVVLLDAAPEPADDVQVLRDPASIYKIAGDLLVWRDGPRKTADLSFTVKQRLEAMPEYRPGSLRHLFAELL